MGKGYRPGRLAEEIRRIVSEMLLRELKDPRFKGMVSVSAVDVTEDGSYATLYVTALALTPDGELSQDGRELDDIPFEETRNYVERVNTAYDIYKMLYH